MAGGAGGKRLASAAIERGTRNIYRLIRCADELRRWYSVQ
jgi:hypothetical protein